MQPYIPWTLYSESLFVTLGHFLCLAYTTGSEFSPSLCAPHSWISVFFKISSQYHQKLLSGHCSNGCLSIESGDLTFSGTHPSCVQLPTCVTSDESDSCLSVELVFYVWHAPSTSIWTYAKFWVETHYFYLWSLVIVAAKFMLNLWIFHIFVSYLISLGSHFSPILLSWPTNN